MMNVYSILLKVIFLANVLQCQYLCGQNSFYETLSDSTVSIIDPEIEYNPSYFTIPYPNGDVPEQIGVCTDVVIRAYRKLGIDLQKEVHEDMKSNFSKYPKNWGLKSTDRNIDHRRVPNLMTFFNRKGESIPVTTTPTNFLPGDIVCWNLGGGMTHIGIVVRVKSKIDSHRYQIVHNIGGGQVLADCLFDYTIIGHYRYQK